MTLIRVVQLSLHFVCLLQKLINKYEAPLPLCITSIRGLARLHPELKPDSHLDAAVSANFGKDRLLETSVLGHLQKYRDVIF